MNMNRTVVVLEKASLLQHGELGVFAARFEKLGLTAYGHTESEAVLELKKLFNKFVRVCRETGQIETRLEQSGVEWYWADEYPSHMPPFEDTNEMFSKPWLDVSSWRDNSHTMAA